MKLRERVYELRLELKVVFANWWKLDARWKYSSNRIDLLQRCQLSHYRIWFWFKLGWWCVSS